MKAEYIPPREDVIMQNQAPEDVYIIVSGEVEMIACNTEGENVKGILKSKDIFGEISALCGRPHFCNFRTKTLSQLLRLNKKTLIDALQTKQEDCKVVLKNLIKVTTILHVDT